MDGGSGAMISLQGGHFVPVPLGALFDAQSGRMRVRLVDLLSTRYAIARRYMIRLRRDDFEDPHELGKLRPQRECLWTPFDGNFNTSSSVNRHRWSSMLQTQPTCRRQWTLAG
jgi:hypothetical protein